MLILPIEHRPDWRKPPYVTLALVLFNFLIFVFYQSLDDFKFRESVRFYFDANLIEPEYPRLLEYLEQRDPASVEILQEAVGTERFAQLYYQRLLSAKNFDEWLREYWRDRPVPSWWLERRDTYEALRDKVSSTQFGFIPDEARPLTLITYAFLHGGWEHLLGNLLFLFVFGFVMERFLGPRRFLGVYLVTGVLSALTFWAVNPGSSTPLIGASGAISGIMGAYIAFFGRRPIRFFYWIVVFAGQWRGPALTVLPLWVAKEIYGVMFGAEGVAYSAHLGGLIAGAVIIVLVRAQLSPPDTHVPHRAERVDLAIQQGLNQIAVAHRTRDYDEAYRVGEEYHRRYPDNESILMAHLQTLAHRADDPNFDQFVWQNLRRLLDRGGSRSAGLAENIFHLYMQASPQRGLLRSWSLLHDLIMAMIRHGRTQSARDLLGLARQYHPDEAGLAELEQSLDRDPWET